MAHVVTPPCLGSLDKACVEVCPVDCFYWNKDKSLNEKYNKPPANGTGYGMLMINPDECIDCAACEAECPTQAIHADSDVPGEYHEFIEKNAAWTSSLSDEAKDAARCTAK
jgi:ferredoxin